MEILDYILRILALLAIIIFLQVLLTHIRFKLSCRDSRCRTKYPYNADLFDEDDKRWD